MKIIGIGDSVIDYYKDQGKKYPGGSVVNVTVFAKRNNAEEAAYLGIIGTDTEGEHLINSLDIEGVNTNRVRRVQGITAEATVTLDERGERIFIGTNEESRVQSLVTLRLNKEDIDYIQYYDIIHATISLNQGLENELPKIKDKVISFDFSTKDYWTTDYLKKVCPYINYAFFSGSDLNNLEINELIKFVHKLGVGIVGVTRGDQAAIFSEKGKRFEQKPLEISVVDTMGAGDSFIASFLTHYHTSRDMEQSLQIASEFAASICRYYGAFGHGLEIEGGSIV